MSKLSDQFGKLKKLQYDAKHYRNKAKREYGEAKTNAGKIEYLSSERDRIKQELDDTTALVNGLACWYKLVKNDLDHYAQAAFMDTLAGRNNNGDKTAENGEIRKGK